MEFSEVLKKRRSTRKFTNEGVSREQIIKLLEAAIAAPNACNMQSWHFYVVTDLGVRNKLREECAITDWATTAPVLFVVCADSARITERFGERADKVFVVQDTAAAIENLLLCAADMGLGGCFMGAFNEEKIRTIVGIKDGHKPLAVVPVGVPAMEMPARPRNPLESVVTFIGDGAGEYSDLDTHYRKFEVKNSSVPEAVFDNVNLKDSTFNNINLSGTKFSDINMKNCKYGGLTMEGSSFGCVDMKKCEFNNTELCCSNFENVTFGGSDMKNVDMSCVEFEKINFKNATFDDVDFSDASFDDVDFSGATADGIDIAEAIEFYKINQDK